MTKNAQVTVPEIIDSVEALTAKMAAILRGSESCKPAENPVSKDGSC